MPNARSRAGSGSWNCVPELPTGPEGAAGRAERTLRLALLFAAWAAWVWPPCCAEGHAVCRPSLPGVWRRAAVWASSPRRRAALAPGVRGADEHVCLSRRCFLTYQSCQSLIYRRCLLHDSIARHPAPEGERPRLARLSASRTVAGRAARLSVQGCGAVRGSSRGSRC